MNIKVASIALFASLVAAATARALCPAATVLPILQRSYSRCLSEHRECGMFVEAFQELVPAYDCRRSFDTHSVPAIWLAGDPALESYVKLLSRLRTRQARRLFASEEFRTVLDGDLAEEYGTKSKARETSAGH